MLWVINAKSFKQNLILASVVTRRLRPIKLDELDPWVPAEKEYEDKIMALREEIKEFDRKMTPVDDLIRQNQRKVDILQKQRNDIESLADSILDNLYRDAYLTSDLREITSTIDPSIETKIRGLQKEKRALSEKIESDEKKLKVWSDLEDMDIDHMPFKKIPFNWLTKENYQKARILSKATAESLFQNFEKISSDLAFDRLKHTHVNYIVFYDLNENMEALKHSLDTLRRSLTALESYIPTVRNSIKASLQGRLSDLIIDYEARVTRGIDESENFVVAKSKVNVQLGMLEMKMEEEIPNAKKERLKEITQEKFSVMREYKGMYDFSWKHERKSWQAANERIFFDTGDGYLFRKLNDHQLLKVSFQEFLQVYGNLPETVTVLH
ncbi:MAG: hypothetical protein HOP08_00820 [Cyclobacteriaceae bacterium]|nr:hypothetical protein [Cyclobacteriaceae bacterium]